MSPGQVRGGARLVSNVLRQAQHERAWENHAQTFARPEPVEGRSPALRFAGYAALFGVPDAARDTILPGAFAATLAARSEPLPLYWQHRPQQRIGWIDAAREDGRGLRVTARLDPGTRPAQLLGAGAVNGLSFGYRARDWRLTPRGRELAEVELLEVSLVTHPLQHGARVHFVC